MLNLITEPAVFLIDDTVPQSFNEDVLQSPQIPKTYSLWNALFNPCIFEFLRQDFQISKIQVVSSEIRVYTKDLTYIGYLNEDDYVYISSDRYTGIYQVDSVETSYITIDATDNGNCTGGYMNSDDVFTNYRAEIQVWYINGSTFENLGTSTMRPAPDGTVVFDPNFLLQDKVNYSEADDYSAINTGCSGLSGAYKLKFREVNSVSSPDFAETRKYFYVAGARQLGDTNGGNYAEFIPVANVNAEYADFLSGFGQPTYFDGFPFDIGFIYSEPITNYQIERHEQQYDVNGGVIGSETSSDLTGGDNKAKVNRLTLSGSYTGFYVDVWLESSSVETPELYVEEDYVSDDYVE